VITVLFNVLSFAAPFRLDTPAFWVAWIFGIVAIVAQFIIYIFFFDKARNLRSKVMSFPLLEVGFIYLLVQVVLSLILMTSGIFLNVPVVVAIIPCVLVIAFFALAFILVNAGRGEIERQDESIRVNTTFMRMLNADVQALIARAKNDTDKIALTKLAEALRYSDPVHVDGLEGIEAEMGQAFLAVKAQVSAGEDASASIEELSLLLSERNGKAKVLKQQSL
jgi:hypothetical protein